jgi:hypothetical protein
MREGPRRRQRHHAQVLVPNLERPDGSLACDLHGWIGSFSRAKLPDIQGRIRNVGLCLIQVFPTWYDEPVAEKAKPRAVFLWEMLADLTRLDTKAEEKLKSLGARLYRLEGNKDSPGVAQIIRMTARSVGVRTAPGCPSALH